MFRKILIISCYILFSLALGAYFYFASALVKDKLSNVPIRNIKIIITDSAENKFVNSEMIMNLLRLEGITANESLLRHVNLYNIETQLKTTYNIKKAEVSDDLSGTLRIEARQRKPLLRLETDDGGFYLDDEAYVFPLDTVYTANVPVVTGSIPLTIPKGFRGRIKENRAWADSLMAIGEYININDFWNSMTEQIDVDNNGNLHITPRVGDIEINFGRPEYIENKFGKLFAFYRDVLPNKGWDRYKEIDARFDNQVVGKLRHPGAPVIKDTTTIK